MQAACRAGASASIPDSVGGGRYTCLILTKTVRRQEESSGLRRPSAAIDGASRSSGPRQLFRWAAYREACLSAAAPAWSHTAAAHATATHATATHAAAAHAAAPASHAEADTALDDDTGRRAGRTTFVDIIVAVARLLALRRID